VGVQSWREIVRLAKFYSRRYSGAVARPDGIPPWSSNDDALRPTCAGADGSRAAPRWSVTRSEHSRVGDRKEIIADPEASPLQALTPDLVRRLLGS
jgi:hypothetical protein